MGSATKKVTTPVDQLTYRIVGYAMALHRELGPGLREDSYQRALGFALADAGMGFEAQKLYSVYGYLAVSGCPIGLLINFGERSLRHWRIFPPQKLTDHLLNRQWLFVPDWLKLEQSPDP